MERTLDQIRQPSFEQFVEVADQVVLINYDLNTGDSRSCGSFEGSWATPLGLLSLTAVYDTSGNTQEQSWKLNGELLVRDVEKWEELYCDADFQFPHYYVGDKAADAWRERFDGTEISGLLAYAADAADED